MMVGLKGSRWMSRDGKAHVWEEKRWSCRSKGKCKCLSQIMQ